MMNIIVTLMLALVVPSAFDVSQASDPTTKVLQGTWVLTSINGQEAPAGSPELSITFAGDKYHQTLGGEVNERGSYKIDSAKKPMTIDLTITEGQDAGKTQLGVLEISGGTLRVNLDTPGANQRPTDFTAKEGSLLFVATKKPAK